MRLIFSLSLLLCARLAEGPLLARATCLPSACLEIGKHEPKRQSATSPVLASAARQPPVQQQVTPVDWPAPPSLCLSIYLRASAASRAPPVSVFLLLAKLSAVLMAAARAANQLQRRMDKHSSLISLFGCTWTACLSVRHDNNGNNQGIIAASSSALPINLMPGFSALSINTPFS